MAVIAASNLDYGYHPPKLALYLDVALDDDLVGDERDSLSCESNVGESFHDLRRHEDSHACGRQSTDEAVERLAEVLTKCRRQCNLETRQRIYDDALCIKPIHGLENCMEGLVDGQIERSEVDELERPGTDLLANL